MTTAEEGVHTISLVKKIDLGTAGVFAGFVLIGVAAKANPKPRADGAVMHLVVQHGAGTPELPKFRSDIARQVWEAKRGNACVYIRSRAVANLLIANPLPTTVKAAIRKDLDRAVAERWDMRGYDNHMLLFVKPEAITAIRDWARTYAEGGSDEAARATLARRVLADLEAQAANGGHRVEHAARLIRETA